ncbi:DUF5655 domain-containing protein [Rhodococcus rhodochrous]|uniref:DUF5655 domain-containing protein n=1 Tax=Rhodococcus rhodochrous KG-21 TaxID=1441923 RepID=A0A0M8PFE6_RHORH|nr:DUF5655 domain-containing protein [Rhodococcus rhodochrous]KOS53825.1 hypothetical protein Z051_23410 [Rhodococcus rhodochrous KG-21]
MHATIDDYLADKDDAAVDMFCRLRTLVLGLGDDVEEQVRPAEVRWGRGRVFAAAFVYSSRLEIAVDLPRRVHHPQLREAFPTTAKVTTHRLSIATPDQLDDGVVALLAEAYETAGERAR